MKRTKSQVTMLMIVGLVIVIMVSLVLYLYKSTVKKYGQQSIRQSQDVTFDAQSVKDFTTNCLSNLGKESVTLLGKQGGYIYQSQGGALLDYDDSLEGKFFLRYGGNKVSYNINRIFQSYESPVYFGKIPGYPWRTFPYETDSVGQELFEAPVFGLSAMPHLYSDQAPHSIESQMEAFIDNKIQSCANFSWFESQGYDVEISGSRTNITIGSSDVIINSDIPIKVTNAATKQTFEFNAFSTRLDIRLGGVYSYVKTLIEKDATNIAFNITGAQNNIGSMSVAKIELENSHDDLIKVTDEKSLINGRPFEYTFARKNRNPALYYLIQDTVERPAGHMISESDLISGNPGSQLKAMDPDEDSIDFRIYIGEFGQTEAPPWPQLSIDHITFRIEVSDGELVDYQLITVNKI